jgi:polyisoprenoid-binding protein YceI
MIKKLPLFILSLALAVPASAEVLHYKIDSVHSGINFKVRHFINKIPGTFTSFSGDIHFDPENPANSKVVAKIDVKSVDTRNDKRDAHLQNDDFFNEPEFPHIEFVSTEWTATGDDTFLVKGTLTMMGTTNPIEMEVTYLGEMEARKAIRSGWEGKAVLNRADWGMKGGQPAVGLEVQVELNIQAHR